jgi:hypothetical protein
MAAMGQRPPHPPLQPPNDHLPFRLRQRRTVEPSEVVDDDNKTLEQILDDLRAMGEKLSASTKAQIRDIKLRGSHSTGPDPASHELSAGKKAEADTLSRVVEHNDEEKMVKATNVQDKSA